MNTFGKEAEARLLSAVRQVQGHVTSGLDPNAAIVKVAQDGQLPSNYLPLIVQAYNVGRQTYQREKHAGLSILEKTANFPVASIEQVTAELYPKNPSPPADAFNKTAVSYEYSLPPRPDRREEVAYMQKIAAIKLPVSEEAPSPVLNKVAKQINARKVAQRDESEKQSQARLARDRFLGAMGQLGDYFKQASYNRLSFAEVEYNATCIFGPLAKNAMDFVYTRNRMKEARANGPPRLARAVRQDAAPYSLIKIAIDCGGDLLNAQRTRLASEKTAQAANDLMTPFEPAPAGQASKLLGRYEPAFLDQKQAGYLSSLVTGLVGGGIGSALRGSAGTTLETPGAATGELVSETEAKLGDPMHVNELRQIKARAMMNDLMANDDVISGFDPTEVSEAYNELVQLTPSLATQPAVLRPLLRKRLTAGSLEPFEAQQMADIEKSVRQSQKPIPVLSGEFGGGQPSTSQLLS